MYVIILVSVDGTILDDGEGDELTRAHGIMTVYAVFYATHFAA